MYVSVPEWNGLLFFVLLLFTLSMKQEIFQNKSNM